ncbi:hypothetical protein PsYK624_087280 [Phanerochaete sordida]|uniref:Uncharacterized protein n=1 Tax=Phanerochaete sordida TaxID=48140 RepID=A0A9P3GCW8_9APHY|nr:hypothetical protein PsYK624_087280 [Phanerochaete sordida]
MACPVPPSLNDTISALTSALNASEDAPWVQAMYTALLPSFTSGGASWLQPLVCGGQLSKTCIALCPNQDLAGIGVRVAFYFQSFVTALLVVFSPTDSVPTAWAGTLLTASLIIAAMVSKVNGNLTLHHATLVLNFATLSCISSLAVAPMLPIWRLSPGEYYEQERQRHALILATGGGDPRDRDQNIIEATMSSNVRKRQVKRAQRRARIVLSLAILIQVVLQWAWGIYLFSSWTYSQPECNASTILFIFFAQFSTRDINSVERNGVRFFIWPVWLLFCLGITFALVVILALSSSDRAAPLSSSMSRTGLSTGTRRSTTTPAFAAWTQIAREMVPPWNDYRAQFYFWCNFVSFALWVMFVASSELQKQRNCIFEGENDFGGLGQITAVGVSIVPLWSLAVALYKYPELRKKQRQHLAQATGQALRGNDELPTTAPPPRTGTQASAANVGYQPRHAPRPSDASSQSSGEEHEMQPLAARWRSHSYSPVHAGEPASPPLPRRPTGPRSPPHSSRRRHTYARHPSGSGNDHTTP